MLNRRNFGLVMFGAGLFANRVNAQQNRQEQTGFKLDMSDYMTKDLQPKDLNELMKKAFEKILQWKQIPSDDVGIDLNLRSSISHHYTGTFIKLNEAGRQVELRYDLWHADILPKRENYKFRFFFEHEPLNLDGSVRVDSPYHINSVNITSGQGSGNNFVINFPHGSENNSKEIKSYGYAGDSEQTNFIVLQGEVIKENGGIAAVDSKSGEYKKVLRLVAGILEMITTEN